MPGLLSSPFHRGPAAVSSDGDRPWREGRIHQSRQKDGSLRGQYAQQPTSCSRTIPTWLTRRYRSRRQRAGAASVLPADGRKRQPIGEAAGIEIQLAEIGGSTGGRLSDIRVLATALKGRKVHPNVRLQVVPATRGIYLAALREGLIETIVEAGGHHLSAQRRFQSSRQHGRDERRRSDALDASPQFSWAQWTP